MNKERRKDLQSVIDQLEELKGTLEDLEQEEINCRDNMPENMKASTRYEEADEICDNLGNAVSQVEDVIDSITAAIEE